VITATTTLWHAAYVMEQRPLPHEAISSRPSATTRLELTCHPHPELDLLRAAASAARRQNGRAKSAIWPTRGWGTSAQPRTSHGIADHEWRCWPLHKNAMPELAHIGRSARCRPSCDRQASSPVAHQLADMRRGSAGGSHRQYWTSILDPHHVPHHALHCRITPYIEIKAAPLRTAAGPALTPGSALGRPARRTPGRTLGWHADQVGSHRQADRYSTRAVFLAAPSSSSRPPRPGRSLLVASHAIGYADPEPGVRSLWIGRLLRKTEE
jgi:hypothetical protein